MPPGTPELASPHVEWFVRFLRPEKVVSLRDLPGAGIGREAVAQLFGIDERSYRALEVRFRTAVEAAAARIVEDERAQASLRRLAEGSGPIVALGDSNTDDRQSWAEILDRALSLSKPGATVRVLNSGLSGSTSADVLSRIGDVERLHPSLAIVLVGTNDARRQGPRDMAMAVSDRETERNVRLIADHLRDLTGTEPVWITPPPVLERRLRDHPYMSRWRVTYLADEVAAKAAIVRRVGRRVVDAHARLAEDLDRALVDDGVHLSAEGQVAVVRLLLDELVATK